VRLDENAADPDLEQGDGRLTPVVGKHYKLIGGGI